MRPAIAQVASPVVSLTCTFGNSMRQCAGFVYFYVIEIQLLGCYAKTVVPGLSKGVLKLKIKTFE